MTVVSFFAGCGGLDLGYEQVGFRVVWANEFNPHCRATYLRNHPDTEFVLGDVFTMFLDNLNEVGYDVKWQMLDAVNYGVPQNRERVFIVGFRKDLNVSYEFPCATYPAPIPRHQCD